MRSPSRKKTKTDNLTGKQEDKLIKVVSFFTAFAIALTIFNILYSTWILDAIFETIGRTIMLVFYGFKEAVAHVSETAAMYIPDIEDQELTLGQGSTFILSIVTFLSRRAKELFVTIIKYIVQV